MKNTTIIKQSGFFSSHPDALFMLLSELPESIIVSCVISRLYANSVDVISNACDKYVNSDLTLLLELSYLFFPSHGVTVAAPLDQFFLGAATVAP